MKRFFDRNLQTSGRILRGVTAIILLVTTLFAFPFSPILGLLLLVAGLFVLFEALRGWCVLRACGVRTKF